MKENYGSVPDFMGGMKDDEARVVGKDRGTKQAILLSVKDGRLWTHDGGNLKGQRKSINLEGNQRMKSMDP